MHPYNQLPLARSLFLLLSLLSIAACQRETVNPVFPETTCTHGSLQSYAEKDGIVVIEAEDTLAEGWQLEQRIDNYSGQGYIVWRGEDQMNKPGEGLQQYRIKITRTGTYRIQLRARIAQGEQSTEHNDVWLRLPDAADYYGKKAKDGHLDYPKGSGKMPVPKGAGKDGWFKSYFNKLNTWGWQTHTSDHDAHQIYADFDQTGNYTLQLSGRSSGFAIDRIVLYHTTVSEQEATAISLAGSEKVCQ